MINILLSILVSYFLGSIPFAIIITYIIKKVDVRQYGSKNAGATNVYRVAGLPSALLVGILDLAKGFVAVYFVSRLLHNPEIIPLSYLQIICAIAVVLGHMLTIFAGFKGGKGVLAAAGAFLAILPMEVGISFAIFLIILLTTRYVSLGSISAAVFITLLLLAENFIFNKHILSEFIIFSAVITIIVLYAHKSNIKRLITGTENKVGKRSHAA